MEKISIVIPIYKVEKYLCKCVDSVINQSYKNIEIILVDDGSPDKCGEMCDKYAKKDKRIKVIHKKNGGLSDARNAGIDIATGKYIAFIDSDDYVSLNFCEILYNNIKKFKADIAVCMYQTFKEKENVSERIVDESIEMDSTEALNNLYNDDNEISLAMTVAWGKLYKKSLFDTIKYPYGKIHEDEFVIHHLYGNANKIVLNKSILYYYLERDDSIMGENFSIKNLDVLEGRMDRIKFFAKNGMKNLEQKACKQYNRFVRKSYYLIKDKKIKKMIKKKFLPIEKVNDGYKLKDYISYYTFKFAPDLIKLIKHK